MTICETSPVLMLNSIVTGFESGYMGKMRDKCCLYCKPAEGAMYRGFALFKIEFFFDNSYLLWS